LYDGHKPGRNHGAEPLTEDFCRAVGNVVIMDLTIPGGIGGKETIKQLRHLDPAVNAIVSSGYSDDSVIANYKDYGFSGCINKPYQIKELSETLAQVLDSRVLTK